MKKLVVIGGVSVAVVALTLVLLRMYTKSFSPKDIVEYNDDDLVVTIEYSRPYKNGRKIFGELVPYNQIWRTGANEVTVLTTNKDIKLNGQLLKAGSYSLFTIPSMDSWKIILNSETGQWGIKLPSLEANKDDENDVLTTEVSVIKTQNTFEQFTISFEKMGDENELILMWDQTLVVIPFTNP